ncbi:tubulin polyglutamylase complex subunit 2-like isoform X1 [Acipenser ruthenus]|uniref:tubulin polyglutamylase complex subunit 2-like isoform X1 n=1 Tax=Acipenser ruthenus TaxID=7906 RepID=UPI002741015E|nr:tubulin polyglutamylase complex subunit 2-like isoform X1 [Acipenser ruthenus]
MRCIIKFSKRNNTVMGEVMNGDSMKGVVDLLTLGITRILESRPGVTDVKFVEKEPAERHVILSWELKHCCILPEDLRDFYLTTDGFQLTWSAKFDGQPVPLGSMVINSVCALSPLCESPLYSLPSAPTLADLDSESDSEGVKSQPVKPHFDSRSRIFELDACNGNGKVCLVYRNVKPRLVAQQCEVWFLDRALYWHFLTESFIAYYRLMVTHLGLPEWQYRFTKYGPSPQTKQWSCLYRPITSSCDPHTDQGEPFLNKLDPNRAFRGKAKLPTPKKKIATQSTGAQRGRNMGASAARK